MKKYKVTFLLDKKNLWFEKQLKNYKFKKGVNIFFQYQKIIKKLKNKI